MHRIDATQFIILATIKLTANLKNTWAFLLQSVNPFFYSKSFFPPYFEFSNLGCSLSASGTYMQLFMVLEFFPNYFKDLLLR